MVKQLNELSIKFYMGKREIKMKKMIFFAVCIMGILYIRRKEIDEIIEYFSVDYEPTDKQPIMWDCE